jgi:hypothetical protein
MRGMRRAGDAPRVSGRGPVTPDGRRVAGRVSGAAATRGLLRIGERAAAVRVGVLSGERVKLARRNLGLTAERRR